MLSSGCRGTWSVIRCWWECEMVQPLWRKFVVSCNTEHALTLPPIKCTFGHLEKWNLCRCKNLYVNSHSSLLVITKNWKTTQIAFRGWINCGTSILWNILLSNANKHYWYTKQLGCSQGSYTEWKKTNLKRLHTVWFHLCKILFIVVKNTKLAILTIFKCTVR